MFLSVLCGSLVLAAFASHFFGSWIPDFLWLKIFFWAALGVCSFWGMFSDRAVFRQSAPMLSGLLAFMIFNQGYRSPEGEMEKYFSGTEKPESFRVVDIPGFQGRMFHFEAVVEQGGESKKNPYRIHIESRQKLEQIRVGMRIKIKAEVVSILKTEPGSYRSYLIEKGVAYKARIRSPEDLEILSQADTAGITTHYDLREMTFPMRRVYLNLMEHLRKKFDHHVGAPASALSYGLVTGIKSTLPAEVREDFRMTGTYHILAVSGSHAVILSAIFFSLLRFFHFSVRWSSILLLFVIFPPYLFVTDFQISIIRTWLMLVLAFLISLTGRTVRPLHVLAFVFAAVVFSDPGEIYSISFQLSFAAVFGMLLFVEFIRVRDIKNNIFRYVLISLGAQIMTAPIVIYFFGYINYFSLFYNALIEFLIPVSLLYSLLLALSPLDWLNAVLGGALWVVNEATFQVIHLTRRDFSFFSTGLQGNLWFATFLFTGFAAGLFLLAKWKKKNRRTNEINS